MNDALVLRAALAAGPEGRAFEPFRDGIEICWLYRNGEHGPAAAFLRYAAGARVPMHLHAGYEHVLILRGSQTDRTGRQGAGTLVVNPPGTRHEVLSEEGCLALVIWERPVIFEPAAED
ncbi:MAG TPA: cupin domain-containing protein [Stellaceae bacterium]|jgi:anti-sigma factor ChrR (cupin superfamily)|nr:cupin domain-containing protein [Stellaceae bacterium]